MPEVTDDERGRRIFRIHQERAVETALEKIRLSLGQDWKLYSAADIDVLRAILGECWVFMERRDWERCAFTRLSRNETDDLIRIGKEMTRKVRLESEAAAEAIVVLKRVS